MKQQQQRKRVALVTGASRGIGAAIAKRLAADDMTVVINYNARQEAAEAVVREIEAGGGQAEAIQADLADPEQIARLFAEIQTRFTRLAVLVNNAALADRQPLGDITNAAYAQTFDLNVRAVLLCMQAAVPLFGAEGGHIVNLSSGIVKAPTPNAALYAASKAAVETLTTHLAAELGPRRITVNVVAPGLTETEMLHTAMTPEAIQSLLNQTPLGRLGTPADIADVVAFLCSDAARWITGQIIGVSGGLR